MSEITIPADQPDASFGSLGSRYYGIWRLPHGPWKQLLGRNKERLYFASAQEATRAAMAHVNSILFRPIRAETAAEPDPVADGLLADIAAFHDRKAAERREDLRLMRRGDGKRPVEVITKKRTRA